jgi:hydroxymethylpyrimidine pyrophosphatase-like HAD family hydrolase
MRYRALACDYDGTVAASGRVADPTRAALAAVRASGRRLLLVTGRERSDLERVLPDPELFDLVVAENGAVLYWPRPRVERLLGTAPPAALAAALRAQGVTPLVSGRATLATTQAHERTVRETIRALGLALEVELNQGSVMVLPAGVSKGTGLAAALAEFGVTPTEVVGVGDAENDVALLDRCGYVGNAVPALRARADVVLAADGEGVREVAEALVASDLEGWPRRARP